MPISAIASSSPAPPSSGSSPWKQRTSTPTAAPTVTRFSATASSASTGARNAASSTRNVTSESTRTSGMKRLLVAWSKSSRTTAGPPITADARIARAVRSASRCSAGRSAGALLGERPAARDDDHARGVAAGLRVRRERDVRLLPAACAPSIAASTKYPESAARFEVGPVAAQLAPAARRSSSARARRSRACVFSARPIWLLPAVARPSSARELLRAVVPVRPVQQRRRARR